jgi:hypothetical protein
MLTTRIFKTMLGGFAVILALGVWSPSTQAEPVHFKELMALLAIEPPSGWEVSEKPKGTTLKSPVQMSEAEVALSSGEDKNIEFKIVDGLGGMAPFLGMAQGMEMESSEEYMKPFEIQGFKGMETINIRTNRERSSCRWPTAFWSPLLEKAWTTPRS